MSGTQTRNRMADQKRDQESMAQHAYSVSEDCLKDNPLTSTMVVFGAGAAIGLLIANALSSREEETKRDYFSQLGRQISSSIGSAIPESLYRR